MPDSRDISQIVDDYTLYVNSNPLATESSFTTYLENFLKQRTETLESAKGAFYHKLHLGNALKKAGYSINENSNS